MTDQHVLIIGAGLAGPALALALKRHGIHSTIFEIRPELSESGGSITLAANAVRALKTLGGDELYDQITSAGYLYSRMTAYLDTGYRYGDLIVGEEGYPAVRIMRTRLNRLLVDSCADKGVEVVWGKKLESIRENEEGVEAVFEDGSIVKGTILIGADGIHSYTRKHVIPQPPKPTYAGTCVINGFLPRSSVITPSSKYTFPTMIFSPAGLIMTIPVDPSGERLAWGITKTLAGDKGRAGWAEYESSGSAYREAKADFDDIKTQPIRSLLDSAKADQAKLWAAYSIPELPIWHTGRVCLIGDAAHALPPNGQGSAMAFEDAAFLVRLLTSSQAVGKGYKALFGHWEKVRRKRVDEIRRHSKVAGTMKMSHHPDSWAWWAKTWLFWGFITVLKRGEMKPTGFSGYDVDAEDIQVE